ncbi:1968_t:CDS:10 [Paraglomus occultum]|uniref:1968_t:CDS:1 n=1 Tax=Paraglomus occultum TaxID=144539 RepID=A0A9N9FRT8_9GLOM|nr:1968_t:CDS:10 [Paraglomus occultum]
MKQRPENIPRTTRHNPRAVPGTKSVLLKNGIILDGVGGIVRGDLLMKNGIIENFGNEIDEGEADVVIDVHGKFISPGIVDMHSHAGVDSWPELRGSSDVNERTDPITPFVRTIDAINPSDPAFRIIASGGVTTVLIIPGSAELMGGEGFVIKLRPVSTLSVQDMGINANVDPGSERIWRWMKMACGENPKNAFGNSGKGMPKSRLGEAWLFRKNFDAASKLKASQDTWCHTALRLNYNEAMDSFFPEDLRYESLVALLRGDVRLNIHCYETMDLEAMIRHSYEFNFNITAFHHALDAYRIPDIIKRSRNQITIATFADHWGYKKEAFQASTQSPRILAEAGIPVALKSDHPVLNSQHLAFEAAIASYYGLSEHQALAAITSVPARALGIDHRVGRIAVGYDADVLVWNRHPLALGAYPLEVFIDGIPQFNTSSSVLSGPTDETYTFYNATRHSPVDTKERVVSSVIIKNIGKIFVGEESIMESTATGSLTITVSEGRIMCIGSDCTITNTIGYDVVDLNGGYVLPGIIAAGSDLGLSEIEQEPITQDGYVSSFKSPDHPERIIIRAVDGLKFGGKHLEEAYKAGVLTIISPPMARKGVLVGVSAAFKSGGNSVIDDEDEVIVKAEVALHAQVGTPYKDESVTTVSGQIAFLRKALSDNLSLEGSPNFYALAAKGDIPFAVYTHSKDEIASLIRLKDEIDGAGGNLRLVIVGGAESYLLASHLAKRNIPVVVIPARPVPELWTAQNVLTGPPISNKTHIEILHEHKVLVGIGVSDPGLARNLAWDAGWVCKNSKNNAISEKDAIGFISWNLERIFGVGKHVEGKGKNKGFSVGATADFVAYDGSPFDMRSRVKLVAGGGKRQIIIDPKQE